MKTVKFIPAITLTNWKGDPWPNANRPTTLDQFDFMMERTADQGFAGSRRGIKQVEFTIAVRKALQDQKESASEKGEWEFEDAHFEAFKESLSNAEYPQHLAHNFEAFTKVFVEG